jgi:NCAIR mutase (PurE)-related protein
MHDRAATPLTPGPDTSGTPATGLTAAGIRQVLERVARGEVGVDQAMSSLRDLPSQSMGFATLDHHRHLRKGFGEVVYCAGKTEDQVAAIIAKLAELSPQVLGTRATPKQYEAALARVPDLQYHALAQAIWLDRDPKRTRLPGAAVVAAGTSDLPVAEEAALTLDMMGHAPARFFDVGVAGLHRLVEHLPALRACHVIVAVAGMEGAMPSVLGGLVPATIIAVPTSVGYGASFHGLAALLGMLNSCAPGVAVVNIDNGFGAGFLAAGINRKIHEGANART